MVEDRKVHRKKPGVFAQAHIKKILIICSLVFYAVAMVVCTNIMISVKLEK